MGASGTRRARLGGVVKLKCVCGCDMQPGDWEPGAAAGEYRVHRCLHCDKKAVEYREI